MVRKRNKMNLPMSKIKLNKSKIWEWTQSDMVGCLGPWLVRIAGCGRGVRHSSVERLEGKGQSCGGEDCRGPAVVASFFLCCQLCFPLRLAGLLAGALSGSRCLHSSSLGYRCSAGVEVGDWEPSVKCDLGDKTVSSARHHGYPLPQAKCPVVCS
jgi:hypothetical protein